MNRLPRRSKIRPFGPIIVDTVIYAALVAVYFLVVLRVLAAPLTRLFHTDHELYALVAFALIIAQGVGFDILLVFLGKRQRGGEA